MSAEMYRRENNEVQSGTASVLLIDDEEMVLDVSKELLEGLGYRVITAISGKEAVAALETAKETVDLVIMDFTMPEMSGEETFSRLKAVNPKVPVLISSGFSPNNEVRNILQQGDTGFIQKPFGLEALSQKVREMLSA